MANDIFHKEQTVVTPTQAQHINAIKTKAEELVDCIYNFNNANLEKVTGGKARLINIAITHLETAVMFAVKAITHPFIAPGVEEGYKPAGNQLGAKSPMQAVTMPGATPTPQSAGIDPAPAPVTPQPTAVSTAPAPEVAPVNPTVPETIDLDPTPPARTGTENASLNQTTAPSITGYTAGSVA